MLKNTIALITLLLMLSSCSNILLCMYGMKKEKERSTGDILKYAKKYKIPQDDVYVLSRAYLSFLDSLDKLEINKHNLPIYPDCFSSPEVKNHYQPLQAAYYSDSGKLISFHLNCYAGGFPNLKWRNFNEFVPKTQAPLDSLLSIENYMRFVTNINGNQNTEPHNYYVFVHWGIFLGRQSKRFIKEVQNNVKLSKDSKVKIFYINVDNVFAESQVP